MKPSEITLEVCCCTEWLRENTCLDLEAIEDGMHDTAASELGREIVRRLDAAGYVTAHPKGQRSLYHGWNGANTFTHKLSAVGTFDSLTNEQVSEIEDAQCNALDHIQKLFATT